MKVSLASWVLVIFSLQFISSNICFVLLFSFSFVQIVRDGWLTCGATVKIGIIVNLPNSNWRKSEFQPFLKNANKIHQFFWDRSDYCDHLLGLAAKLSPGHSELRGWDETLSQSYSGVNFNKQMLQVSSLGTTWSSIAARPVGLAEDEVHYPAVHPQPQGALRQPQGDHYHPRAHQGWLRWGSQWTQGWNS